MPLTSTGEPGGIESASYPTKYQYGNYVNQSRLIQLHTANKIPLNAIATQTNAQYAHRINFCTGRKCFHGLLQSHTTPHYSCANAYEAGLAPQIGMSFGFAAPLAASSGHRTALCATGCTCELTICLTCAPQAAQLLMQARTRLKA